LKITSGTAVDSVISILVKKAAEHNILKPVVVSVSVIISVIFGPIIVENNEFLENNYSSFLEWKSAFLGAPYSANTGTLDQDVVLPQTETDADVIADFDDPEPRPGQPSSVINDENSESQIEFVPPAAENNPPSSSAPSEFDDSTFGILLSDPKKFIGYEATITGQVYDILRLDNSNLNFRMVNLASASPDNSRVLVGISSANVARTTVSSIQVEDCIIVQGLVRNSVSDRNSLGRTIQVPMIEGFSVSEIECIDSALPAYETIEMSDSQSRYGLSLRAQKVQFADDHVRIKLTAENRDRSSMFIRDRDSLAAQGGESYMSTTHLPIFSEYRLDSKLTPESLTEGYLFFERINRNDQPLAFRIVVEQVGITETVTTTFIFTIE
jgi:hypothetical protein